MNAKHAPLFAPLLVLACGLGSLAVAEDLDAAKIESLTGAKGSLNAAAGVFKVGFARTEVKVRVDGQDLSPFRGLGTWAAFTKLPDGRIMVMGDNVLFQDEVNPVLDEALAAGLSVTALHNHFFYDDPKVYFMHVSGTGTQDELAAAIGRIYRKVHEIRKARPKPAGSFGPAPVRGRSAISATPLEALLGVTLEAKDGMAKAVWGRETTMGGATMGAAMGVNTWAVFAGTDAAATVDGDFAMQEGEIQAVLKALRKGGIDIVAIHQHMTGEQPRIIFLHFWGHGPAAALAATIRDALAAQTAATPPPGAGMGM